MSRSPRMALSRPRARRWPARRTSRPSGGGGSATSGWDRQPLRSGVDAAPAAAAGGETVDQQNDHGPDDRADDAGGLQRTLGQVLAEERPTEEPADERADDAQQDR